MTGQPAASAEALSPLATEKAKGKGKGKGKSLALNTATGPRGRAKRHTSGLPVGLLAARVCTIVFITISMLIVIDISHFKRIHRSNDATTTEASVR